MRVKFLFWCLVALNALDVLLTSQILNMGGQEANPIVNAFIEMFGHVGMVYVKGPFLLVLGTALYMYWHDLSTTFRKSTYRVLAALSVAFTVLNAYSLSVYLQYI